MPLIPSPFSILKTALSRVPGLRILFGALAVLAILAIARTWSLDRGWTIVGALVIVLLSFVLLLLAKLGQRGADAFKAPAQILMWFCVVLFMLWATLLTTCVFWKWPIQVMDIK